MQPNTWTIQPVAYDVQVPTEEAVEAGAPAAGILSVVAGIVVPISLQQDGQPLVVPLVNIQAPLDKEHMLQLSQLLADKAEELPDPKPQSDILIANDLSAAERAAQEMGKFRGQ